MEGPDLEFPLYPCTNTPSDPLSYGSSCVSYPKSGPVHAVWNANVSIQSNLIGNIALTASFPNGTSTCINTSSINYDLLVLGCQKGAPHGCTEDSDFKTVLTKNGEWATIDDDNSVSFFSVYQFQEILPNYGSMKAYRVQVKRSIRLSLV